LTLESSKEKTRICETVGVAHILTPPFFHHAAEGPVGAIGKHQLQGRELHRDGDDDEWEVKYNRLKDFYDKTGILKSKPARTQSLEVG
jgi:hypothetical protein